MTDDSPRTGLRASNAGGSKALEHRRMRLVASGKDLSIHGLEPLWGTAYADDSEASETATGLRPTSLSLEVMSLHSWHEGNRHHIDPQSLKRQCWAAESARKQ